MATTGKRHKFNAPGKVIKFQSNDDKRENSSRRNYGAKWRRLRDKTMDDIAIDQGWPYALCQELLKHGERIKATDLDHITPRSLGGTEEPDNLQALCHSCHSIKTAKEDGGFGNRKTK